MKRPRGTYSFTRYTLERFWSFADKRGGEDACWPFDGPVNWGGYAQVAFEGEPMGAQRMSCLLEHGPPPGTRAHASRSALHSCDNPPCVNPRHLRWGSAFQNTLDMLARGRSVRGRKYGAAVRK